MRAASAQHLLHGGHGAYRASPTARPSRGYRRAGARNDRLGRELSDGALAHARRVSTLGTAPRDIAARDACGSHVWVHACLMRLCADRCVAVRVDMRVAMCVDMRSDMRVDMRVDTWLDMGSGMCVDMCVDTWVGMRSGMWVDMCVDVRTDCMHADMRSGMGNSIRNTCAPACLRVRLYTCMHTCLLTCLYSAHTAPTSRTRIGGTNPERSARCTHISYNGHISYNEYGRYN